VRRVLKMVMLDVLKRMTHLFLAGRDLAAPQHLATPYYLHRPGQVVEVAPDGDLRSDRALLQLSMGQV